METLKEYFKRILFKLYGNVIRLKPQGKPRGSVLFSYVITPFLKSNIDTLSGHSNYWEAKQMVKTFLDKGYAVDVIDLRNANFVPKQSYDFFVDVGKNMERLTPFVGDKCTKILHITEMHWKVNNENEQKRIDEVAARRGARLLPRRMAFPQQSIERCNEATILAGTTSTAESYAFAHKQLRPIPISTTHTYEAPAGKDFAKVRKTFLWFGGVGAVHKGLDRVLEAFATMPDYSLVVCGKVVGETDFANMYKKELFETTNIKTVGFVDPGSGEFADIIKSSVGVILDSCAEGCAGSVVLGMHAGLIPIVSRECGVNVQSCGIELAKDTDPIESIREAVRSLSTEPVERLETRAHAAWKYARENHTRELFSKRYKEYVDDVTRAV